MRNMAATRYFVNPTPAVALVPWKRLFLVVSLRLFGSTPNGAKLRCAECSGEGNLTNSIRA